jgi:hypothetical protein
MQEIEQLNIVGVQGIAPLLLVCNISTGVSSKTVTLTGLDRDR